MPSYGRTSGTGGLGSKAYRNDDDTQLQDLPDNGMEDVIEFDLNKVLKDAGLIV